VPLGWRLGFVASEGSQIVGAKGAGSKLTREFVLHVLKQMDSPAAPEPADGQPAAAPVAPAAATTALTADELDVLEAEVQAAAAATSSPASSHALQSLLSPLLCSITGFEWRRQRDLPAILCKPILRPSPPLFLLQAQLRNLLTATATVTASAAMSQPQQQSQQLQPQLHADGDVLSRVRSFVALLSGASEAYLSLGDVSRFHSRQHFVDLAALVRVGRAHLQAWRARADSNSRSDGKENNNEAVPSSASSSVLMDRELHRADLALIEVAVAAAITHPTLMQLAQLQPLLRAWEAHWSAAAAAGEAKEDAAVAAVTQTTAASDFSKLLERSLPALWNIEPASLSPSAAASGDDLSLFFRLPAPLLSSSSAAAASAVAGAADNGNNRNHWPTQDLPLADSCPDPLSLLSNRSLLHCVPASRLLRLVSLKHHLRVDDFPPLASEAEDKEAQRARDNIERLQRTYCVG
jgi:hypothetical protein